MVAALDRVSRFVLRNRRLVAAACAGVAVFCALTALTAEPDGRVVLVAQRDLDSGVTVHGGDLRRVSMPADLVPDRAVVDPSEVVGRSTSGALRRGEVLTDRRTIGAGRLDGFGPDRVLAVVRVSDAGILSLLRPGDVVHVVAVSGDQAPKARILTRAARVVTIPRQRSSFAEGAPIGLAVTPAVALRLAERALDARLAVVAAAPSG